MKYHGHGGELFDSQPCYTSSKVGDFPKQTAVFAEYKVKKPLPGYNLANNLPYDRNWGRSTNWYPLFTEGWKPQFVDDRLTPAVPFAHYRETDYLPLSHEPWSKPYERECIHYVPPTAVRNV